jgi:hypothetical protein
MTAVARLVISNEEPMVQSVQEDPVVQSVLLRKSVLDSIVDAVAAAMEVDCSLELGRVIAFIDAKQERDGQPIGSAPWLNWNVEDLRKLILVPLDHKTLASHNDKYLMLGELRRLFTDKLAAGIPERN